MNYLYLLPIPFIISTGIFIYFFIKIKNKYKTLITNVENFKNDHLRKGYFERTLHLLREKEDRDSGKSDTYRCIIYIKELDRYTNGESKIKLWDIEILNGIDGNQYDHVKAIIRRQFSSVMPSKDITWLESESSLKKIRKEKLQQIIKNAKQKVNI